VPSQGREILISYSDMRRDEGGVPPIGRFDYNCESISADKEDSVTNKNGPKFGPFLFVAGTGTFDGAENEILVVIAV
jgi:hypothetical protein